MKPVADFKNRDRFVDLGLLIAAFAKIGARTMVTRSFSHILPEFQPYPCRSITPVHPARANENQLWQEVMCLAVKPFTQLVVIHFSVLLFSVPCKTWRSRIEILPPTMTS